MALYYLNYPLSMFIDGKTPTKLPIFFTKLPWGEQFCSDHLQRGPSNDSGSQCETSPVPVVHVLPYDRVGLHRAVRVHLRHVHVV